MVADGQKPATWQLIQSEKWTEGDKETRISAQRWRELNGIFSALGLVSATRIRLDDSTFVQPKDGTHQWIELADIFLSRDQAHADALASAVDAGNHEQIGVLLGFPQSAVEAFMTKTSLPINEWPVSTQVVDEDAMKFLNHMISKDNWETEISYLPAFSQRINELSSKIYNDHINQL